MNASACKPSTQLILNKDILRFMIWLLASPKLGIIYCPQSYPQARMKIYRYKKVASKIPLLKTRL